jgi:hypothetical protein
MRRNILKHVCTIAAIIALLFTVSCQNSSVVEKHDNEREIEWSFNTDGPNSIPTTWKTAETAGVGTPATWEIVIDDSAPSPPQVVAATHSENRGQTYNLLIAEETSYQDVEVKVEVKALNGVEDQGGGPIWRALDESNYYICRWNPLEDNFRVYTVKEGKRRQIGSADIKADADMWHEIEIEHRGTTIIAKFDDETLLSLEDDTFQNAGMVGLWTKADATTAFDDFEVEVAGD